MADTSLISGHADGTAEATDAPLLVWPYPPRQLAAATAALAVVWLAFVFTGSIAAYGLAVLGASALAAALGLRGHWLALYAILVVAALVGTEARGDLGTSTTAFGGVRLLDYVILAAAGGALVHLHRTTLGVTPAAVRAWLRRWLVPLALLAVLLVLWALNGGPLDEQTNTDVRLVLIAIGTTIVARVTLPGHERAFLVATAVLALPLLLKSVALHLSDLWTIGTSDRAQASQVAGPPAKRTILVGGDTVFILAPGIAAAYWRRLSWPSSDRLLAASAAAAVVGVLISGTRTSLIIVAATAVAGVLVNIGGKIHRVPPKTLAIGGLAALVLFIGAAAVSGIGERFVAGDNAHNGLNFRKDEIASIQRVNATDLVAGQGLGGRFRSRDSAGNDIDTPWSHVIAIWVVLKIGLVGLGLALIAAAFALVRTVRSNPPLDQRAALVVLISLILMSMLIGRAALPEGVIIAVACFVILGWGNPAPPSPKAP